MDKAKEHALPQYEDEAAIPYEEAPVYNANSSASANASAKNELGTTLTIDPTGMSIIKLPLGSALPYYTFSTSLLHVYTASSVDIRRTDKNSGKPLAVYAIAEQFMSPLHSVPPRFKDILVRNSAGIFANIGLRKVVWDFSTQAPIPLKDGKVNWQAEDETTGRANGGYLITGSGYVGVQKDLLQFYEGKWVDEYGEVLALAREGGAECKGMPVLSVTKDLDQEMMDFLVSAWCVTLWRDVGKRARHYKPT